ncbi:MAG TPA: lysophospholipid acyltransferase family protein [Anaerolineales bacterium]|nr:lysophospholipid acyltransferase family protein [Anaerolineales bacterium]
MTIFDTPILTGLFRLLTRLLLRLSGWRVHGQLPDFPKFIIIGAPHTSNWDFILMLALGFSLRAKFQFMGKAELFRSPLGWFFRWCGGIPVERNKSVGLVEQMADRIQRSDHFILALTPEGTRDKVSEWKTGFYHIARKANIPIVLGFVDGVNKTVGVGSTINLTDDMQADIKTIQSFYAKMVGIRSHRTSEL